MEIKIIDKNFSICKIQDLSQVNFHDEFCFLSKTDEEISLVCITESIPQSVTEIEKGWKAFRIQGTLDFSLVGILSRISAILAEHNISIFAVSTYNTDYIFVKEIYFLNAITELKEHGYIIS